MPTIGTFRTADSATGNTSKTLADFKSTIAAVVGAQDRPDEVRALDALHAAIDKVNETKWEALLSSGTFTSTAGTADYSLPATTRSVQSVRVTSSNERRLTPIRIDIYDRSVQDQSSPSLPMYYSLHKVGLGRLLTLLPTPDVAEDFLVRVYLDLAKPTIDTTVPQIPAFLERAIILQAQVLVGMWRGLRSERVGTLVGLAEDALRGAQMRDRGWHDMDEGITMQSELAERWPWGHPERDM